MKQYVILIAYQRNLRKLRNNRLELYVVFKNNHHNENSALNQAPANNNTHEALTAMCPTLRRWILRNYCQTAALYSRPLFFVRPHRGQIGTSETEVLFLATKSFARVLRADKEQNARYLGFLPDSHEIIRPNAGARKCSVSRTSKTNKIKH